MWSDRAPLQQTFVFLVCVFSSLYGVLAQQAPPLPPQVVEPLQSAPPVQAAAVVNPPPATPDCAAAEAADFPKAVLSNGIVKAVVYLPDSVRGYYRATRFDWSGVIGCLSAKGHTYFGPWFPRYDPLVNDSISGPVEEFKPTEGAIGYAAATPGELFVKPGVGVLRRVDDKPYSSYFTYPLVDAGTWTSHATRTGVESTQELKSPTGVAYLYRKSLRLEPHAAVLVLEHALTNRGTATLEMDVYNHNFTVLDHEPTGPNTVVRFAFHPEPEHPLPNGGTIQGNELHYTSELQPKQAVNGILTGYSNKVSDYDFTVENRRTHVGVRDTGDHPLSHLNFWSIRTVVCPEGYMHLSISPGETAKWKLRYSFYSK